MAMGVNTISRTTNPATKLAAIGEKWLVRNDSGPFRTYRDKKGRIFHSVTHILSSTSDQTGLDNWRRRVGVERAEQICNLAAQRGTKTHDRAEYLLKTAKKISTYAAQRRRVDRLHDCGLPEVPSNLMRWALAESHASLPKNRIYYSGFAKPLTQWIRDHVTQVYAAEISTYCPFDGIAPLVRGVPFDGFAGTADGLLAIDGSGPLIVDWKTTTRPLAECPDKTHKYKEQLGAYWLGVRSILGLEAEGGLIVAARRLAEPEVIYLSSDEIKECADMFLSRCHTYANQ